MSTEGRVDRIDRRTEQIYVRTVRLGTAVETVPSQTINLGSLQEALVPAATPIAILGERDLAGRATVLDAPLTPLAGDADQARRPAFEALAGMLADGAHVVLDDTDRADEQAIIDSWVSAPVAGRRLTVVEQVGRATVLRVEVVD